MAKESKGLIVATPDRLPGVPGGPQAPVSYVSEMDDSPRRYAAIGWAILLLFFGVLGAWAAIAPLNGAVVSQAVVKVEGKKNAAASGWWNCPRPED
jgi:hypothetical protein